MNTDIICLWKMEHAYFSFWEECAEVAGRSLQCNVTNMLLITQLNCSCDHNEAS